MELLPAPEDTLAAFEGIDLDPEAQAAIIAILESCAARASALDPSDDPDQSFLRPYELRPDHPDAMELPAIGVFSTGSLAEGDEDWRDLDQPDQREEIAAAVAAIEAKKASGEWDREIAEDRKKAAERDRNSRRLQAFEAAGLQSYEWERFCAEWKG